MKNVPHHTFDIVHFSNENIGSIDWELPKQVKKILENSSPQDQLLLSKMIQSTVSLHLQTISTAFCMGAPSRSNQQFDPEAFFLLSDIFKNEIINKLAICSERMKDPHRKK